MFPAWPASGPEPHASRPSAHSFSAPAGPNLPFTFSSRSGQPVNRQMLFAASVFQTRKHEVHIFSASKTIASGLAGQYLPLPILLQPPTRQLIPFRRQPANISRRPSSHTGPQSSASQLPSSRLGRPTPYIPSHHFFNIYKAPSFHQVLLPTILPHIFLFLFSISPSSSRLSPFRTSNSNLIPLLSLRPPLPSCCRFKPAGQTRNVVSRAGAACKAADGAGEEPAFLFFLYVSFFCFSLFSLLFHLPGAAASPRRLHFSFCFCFSFCLFFLFFFFLFFLLAFFAFSFYLFFF